MSFTNITNVENSSRILGFSKVTKILDESDVPGISNKITQKHQSISVQDGDLLDRNPLSSGNTAYVSDTNKILINNQVNVHTRSAAIVQDNRDMSSALTKENEKVNAIKSAMERHFRRIDPSMLSSNAIKPSWLNKINSTSINDTIEVLGIPFYDPDYEHALAIEDELNYLVDKTRSEITTATKPNKQMKAPENDELEYKGKHATKLITKSNLPQSRSTPLGRISSSVTQDLKQLRRAHANDANDNGSDNEINKENQKFHVLRQNLQDIACKSNNDAYRSDELLELGLDRSLLLQQAQSVYSTFLNDIILLSRNRAHQCRSTEELAMHQVLLTV